MGKRTVTETITGTEAGTGNVFDPSNAGYPLLVSHKTRKNSLVFEIPFLSCVCSDFRYLNCIVNPKLSSQVLCVV
jgi:hypothetical protein